MAVVDPGARQMTLSCGAALLNLRVALRRFGYRDATHEPLPDHDDPDPLAGSGSPRARHPRPRSGPCSTRSAAGDDQARARGARAPGPAAERARGGRSAGGGGLDAPRSGRWPGEARHAHARDRVDAGRAMERILLRACAGGATSSFLNQAVEVEALRPRLAAAVGREGGHPQLVMRFGYGPEVAHPPRAPVEEVLIRT